MSQVLIRIPFAFEAIGRRSRSRTEERLELIDVVEALVPSISSSGLDGMLGVETRATGRRDLPVHGARAFAPALLMDGSPVTPMQLNQEAGYILEMGGIQSLSRIGLHPTLLPGDLLQRRGETIPTRIRDAQVRDRTEGNHSTRREMAERVGDALLVIDGQVHSRRFEPMLAPSPVAKLPDTTTWEWILRDTLDVRRMAWLGEGGSTGCSLHADLFDHLPEDVRPPAIEGDTSRVVWRYDAVAGSIAHISTRVFAFAQSILGSAKPMQAFGSTGENSPIVTSMMRCAAHHMDLVGDGEFDPVALEREMARLAAAIEANPLAKSRYGEVAAYHDHLSRHLTLIRELEGAAIQTALRGLPMGI